MTEPEQAMSPAHLLRLHLEAVWWGCAVPDLSLPDVEIDDARAPLVYQGTWTGGSVRIWQRGMTVSDRDALAKALWDPTPSTYQGSSEVVLIQTERPVLSLDAAASIARIIGAAESKLVATHEADSVEYYLGSVERCPIVGVVADGRLVTVAHSSRRTRVAVELGIETLPDYRRRGFALAATIVWAATVRQEGLIPFYSARADNTASLALAAKAGYRPFAWGTSLWKS